MLTIIALACLAYLLGSVPTSVWLGRAVKGVDLREHGSGNAGATNAFRVLGKPLGSVVLVLDMLKGFLAVNLALLQHWVEYGAEGFMVLKIGFGLLAVIGHIFPIFAGFRGGKGVATTTGVALAIHPFAALAAIGIYLLVFLFTRISAVSSLVAVFSYPVWIIWVFQAESMAVRIFSVAVVVMVLITHRSNIRRLIQGQEKSLFSRKQ